MFKRPALNGFQEKSFKGSVKEGATGCLISLRTILRFIGKVKFKVSPTFRFQPEIYMLAVSSFLIIILNT